MLDAQSQLKEDDIEGITEEEQKRQAKADLRLWKRKVTNELMKLDSWEDLLPKYTDPDQDALNKKFIETAKRISEIISGPEAQPEPMEQVTE